jgi:hypothetical protein
MKRDLARLIEAARHRGWQVEKTRKAHWKLRHRSGALVVSSGTPSCPRALLNLSAALKRAERAAA